MKNVPLSVVMGTAVAVFIALLVVGLPTKTGRTLLGVSGDGGSGGNDGGCSTCCGGTLGNGIYSYDGERVFPNFEPVKITLASSNGVINTRYNVTCPCCGCNESEKCGNCDKSEKCEDECPLAGIYRHPGNLIDPVSKQTVQPVQVYLELDHTGNLNPTVNISCEGGVWYCSGTSDCKCPNYGTYAYEGAHMDPQTGRWTPVTIAYGIGPKGRIPVEEKNQIVYPKNPGCPSFG